MLILVAHPDDETLAFGGEMIHWPDCVVAHTTNGSPADTGDAQTSGFDTAEAYAAARQSELKCALAEIGGREIRSFHIVDQHSWLDLAGLTRSVRELIEDIRPSAVFTHPYEGGHPDHDATAFAVQCACDVLGSESPVRLEGAFYNRYGGDLHPNEFIPGLPENVVTLDPESRARKERMFACFRSQQRVLDLFNTERERYRYAPRYDFRRRPHEGVLNYETFGWGITPEMWLASADRALRSSAQ